MMPVELICFHHAGGGAASFHPLRLALADMAVEVAFTAVSLPGRESRRDEPRHVDAETCVQALGDELDEVLRRPHILLGHSMGAILVYLLAQQRISRGLRVAEAVIIASCRAPHLPAPRVDLHLLDDHALATELARYGGLPTEILDRPDWLALLMPTVRDDLRICQSPWRIDAPPLPCPLHILGGLDDPVAPPDTVAAWASYSVRPQPVRMYPGGHFPFRSPKPELVATVAHVVKEAARERSLLP
jgi:surfactin synthase thioesterase subunit